MRYPSFILILQLAVLAASQTYDFVIVGGGTAGLVLANRLSKNGKFSVVVIEAGGFYETDFPDAEIPGMDIAAVGPAGNAIDWQFSTTPQTGANNRVIPYARGKCLGGR